MAQQLRLTGRVGAMGSQSPKKLSGHIVKAPLTRDFGELQDLPIDSILLTEVRPDISIALHLPEERIKAVLSHSALLCHGFIILREEAEKRWPNFCVAVCEVDNVYELLENDDYVEIELIDDDTVTITLLERANTERV